MFTCQLVFTVSFLITTLRSKKTLTQHVNIDDL